MFMDCLGRVEFQVLIFRRVAMLILCVLQEREFYYI